MDEKKIVENVPEGNYNDGFRTGFAENAAT
jgi:hypothetical protein